VRIAVAGGTGLVGTMVVDRAREAGHRVDVLARRTGVDLRQGGAGLAASLSISLIVMAVMMTGLFATLFYVPLLLQSALGYPALAAGLLILPQALVMGFLTPIAGRLYDRIGPRWLVFGGLLIAAYGSYLLSGVGLDVTRGEIVLWMCIRSAGVGMSMMAVMTGGCQPCPMT
jgi:hypothetical protein